MKTNSLFRFSATEQLALYQLFYQHPANRFLHVVALPLVIYSGFVLLDLLTGNYHLAAPIEWPSNLPLNAGFFLLFGSIFMYSCLDKGTAVAVLLWTLPLLLLSNWTVETASWSFLLSLGVVLQALGWYIAVYWGHEKVEPFIKIEEELESTNWYFKQHWYVLKNVGRAPTRLDAWIQYSIGPFDSTLDVLFALGYDPQWKQAIEKQSAIYLNALANGEPLFEPLAWERPFL